MQELTSNDITSLVSKIFDGRTDPGVVPGRVRLPAENPPRFDEQKSVEIITPADAMTLIANCWERYSNGRNFYPTKLDKIIRYAKAMESGEWVYDKDGDPIAITDGLITGGRHRLHAILLSHKPITSNVVRRTTIKEQN